MTTQTPPDGVQTWDFSYKRPTDGTPGRFRWRLDGWEDGDPEWLVDRIAGPIQAVGHDPVKGHLKLRGYMTLRDTEHGTVAYCERDSDDNIIDLATFDPESTYLPYSHYRLCAAKGTENWRLRDERTGTLTMVKSYDGKLELNWFDGGPHVFHDGWAVVDKDGTATLYDADPQEATE